MGALWTASPFKPTLPNVCETVVGSGGRPLHATVCAAGGTRMTMSMTLASGTSSLDITPASSALSVPPQFSVTF